ncbi:hypothetical protein B0A50_05016 [Salinomyces thailandicus]|uniref:Arrestin C-terminal-like domain-containing protein n=1 Tax=Salinomyces thailandicus TaxID=706561 RepID=A0A4U0TYE2_9PEZI|nr:hypothetical protein B0A50_05016 [Salinomyces thailandica]
MVATPRTGHSSARSKPFLEIIPDTRFIVFNGGEHEAQSIKLTGRVRFTAPEAMSILKPRVKLEGKRKISWWFMGGISAGEVVDKRVFWNQEHKLGIESTHKVKAGPIEWPFEFELSPSMPESVEGLRETYVVYHLHAGISRPGWNAKDILAQEHIRIVRTLGQDSMEMTRSRVNADIWANKISYSISIPTDAIVFGTSITADVELSPIKKGLRLGKIELRLMETVVKRIQASEVPDTRGDKTKSEESEVAKTDMDFPENSRVMYEDETTDNPTMADEMYKFKATLPLPKSLNACRQDVDSHQINVTHRFKLMVNIHNPEGHVSQLVCRLPVKIFISPNLPVDERNEVCGTFTPQQDAEINSNETTLVAPPEYGRHQLDQIFSGIDAAGYMSRAGSAPGTPYGFYAQSRRGSHDNVASLNGLANGDGGASPITHGSAAPHILHSRLADLQDRGHNLGANTPGVRFIQHSPSGGSSPAPGIIDDPSSAEVTHRSTPGQSASTSNPYFPSNGHLPHGISRRTSDDHVPDDSHQHNYDLSTLSRVPSYGAALRTPGTAAPFTDGPPSYIDATSRPPSPGLQRPGQAHLRSGASTPNSDSSQQTVSGMFGSLSMAAAPPPRAAHRDSMAESEESRLRFLRAART